MKFNLICLLFGHKWKKEKQAVNYNRETEKMEYDIITYCERCDKVKSCNKCRCRK